MSQVININESPTFIPTGSTGASNISATSTSYPASNGYTDHTSTTYARLTTSSTSTVGYIYYTFSVSDIPSGATITGVSCQAKVRINNTSRVSNTSAQLYYNTTARGTSQTFSTTSSSNVVTIDGGSWTISELSNIRLRLAGQKASSNNTGYIYFYGATLTVSYTLQGIQYDITSTLSTNSVDSISPAGLTQLLEGNNYELTVNASSIDDFKVEDNGVDVTSSLVGHTSQSGSQTFTGIPTSFDSTNSSYDSIYTGTTSDGLTSHTDSNRICVYSNTGSGATSYLYYNFDCSSIPANAIITSVSCIASAAVYQASTYFTTYDLQLCTGTTAKGTATTITGSGGTSATHNINGGTSWTRAELDNIKIRERVVRGTSSTTSQASFSFWGATLTVEYTLPAENQYYWTYSLTNVSADHTIIISDAIIELPEEDPQYNYYPITISSINATTTPGRGTTRVVEGTNQTITIYPSDPLLTLVTDNGVDVSSQLVQHGNGSPTYSVATASGASYGFTLNSSTGYYVSQNAGQASSAAVCRVTFSLPVRCLVTISYINYAEGTYDYGIFGNIDSSLGTTYTADSNVKLACSTSEYNVSTVQTLTYEVEAGSHFIDIKYRKDSGVDSNNDSLQFKIDSITELEANNYYTYTLSNIQTSHSLIFIFGDVTYYFANSSGSGCKLYPDGQIVQLPGDTYRLVIVPDDYSYDVEITDNNTNVTSSVQRTEQEITKNGETVTVVNYIYTISNIQATHNIQVACTSGTSLYLKVDGSFIRITKIYRKIEGEWEEISIQSMTDNELYFYKGRAVNPAAEIGSVSLSNDNVQIQINDNSLSSGTYTLKYEDSTRTPITNMDKIATFTI